MLYFAFGSNLDPEQMRERCPAHRQIGVAVLRDHKLVFPIFSESWGGGVASLQLSHGNDVWGVLHELSDRTSPPSTATRASAAPATPTTSTSASTSGWSWCGPRTARCRAA